MMRRSLRVLPLLLGLFLLSSCLSQTMLNFSLRPKLERPSVDSAARKACRENPEIEGWLDSLRTAKALRDTFVFAPDGARLHAYYVRAARPTSRTAVLVHGYAANAFSMMMVGYAYQSQTDFNLLLPDLRNSGKSDGDHYGMGWTDRLDVKQWIGVAAHLFGDTARIVVHGISMGAATVMMLSGDTLPPTVKCFVEDCGYTSVWDEFAHVLHKRFLLPSFPLMNLTSQLCKKRYGWSFQEASALEQVKKCRLPMLFIHGDADIFVPTRMVYPLFKAKPGEKELWITKGVPHARSYRCYPSEYRRRVAEFVEKWMR